MNNLITVPCDERVERLLDRQFRVIISDFDGYGSIETIEDGEALVRLER